MTKDEADRLVAECEQLKRTIRELNDEIRDMRAKQAAAPAMAWKSPAEPLAPNEATATYRPPLASPHFDSLYTEVKNRLLAEGVVAAGTAVVRVTSPEKLRKDFQREEAARLVAAAKALSPLQGRVLKLVETTDGFVSQKAIAERLGRATGGGSWVTLTTAVRDLGALGFVEVKERQGVRRALRAKVAADLAFYQATDAEVEATYQAVLYELATDDGGGRE